MASADNVKSQPLGDTDAASFSSKGKIRKSSGPESAAARAAKERPRVGDTSGTELPPGEKICELCVLGKSDCSIADPNGRVSACCLASSAKDRPTLLGGLAECSFVRSDKPFVAGSANGLFDIAYSWAKLEKENGGLLSLKLGL